ncbi:hypothetical protein GCM10022198_25510 [Klugiella xanthotipulae]
MRTLPGLTVLLALVVGMLGAHILPAAATGANAATGASISDDADGADGGHPCANAGEPTTVVCAPPTTKPALIRVLAEPSAVTLVTRSVDPVLPPELGIPAQARSPQELSISRT